VKDPINVKNVKEPFQKVATLGLIRKHMRMNRVLLVREAEEETVQFLALLTIVQCQLVNKSNSTFINNYHLVMQIKKLLKIKETKK
jgi:hypothetical protein